MATRRTRADVAALEAKLEAMRVQPSLEDLVTDVKARVSSLAGEIEKLTTLLKERGEWPRSDDR